MRKSELRVEDLPQSTNVGGLGSAAPHFDEGVGEKTQLHARGREGLGPAVICRWGKEDIRGNHAYFGNLAT